MSDLMKVTEDAIAAFLGEQARATTERPRLVFAIDATASRQLTWDNACHVQGQMFQEAGRLGGLDVQLVYFRGLGECKASPWVSNAEQLVHRMIDVSCRGGITQLVKVLRHVAKMTEEKPVAAMVFVGDTFEERFDDARAGAEKLKRAGVKCFMFQDNIAGESMVATQCFGEIARVTGGAHVPFGPGASAALRELLGAVAAYAAGGNAALADLRTEGARLIANQVGG